MEETCGNLLVGGKEVFNFFNDLSNEKVYIFGAGQRGIKLGYILENRGIDIKGFIDNNSDKIGTKIFNKECFNIDTIIKETCGDIYIIVSAKKSEAIFEQLQKLDIDMNRVYTYEKILKEHYFTPPIKEQDDYKNVHPFNHYESPYPNIVEIHEKESEIFDYQKKVLDIDFNIQRQLEIVDLMNNIDVLDWEECEKNGYRYYYDNIWFSEGCAKVLYYMMRILKPNRIIEVGSGFSTAVMLDTNNVCFQNSIEINSIEPNTDRLKSLLKKDDNLKIQECKLQDIPLEFFSQLQENDILFIDSSHVSKIDSDVNYYLFEILPRLKKGVYIHFHDMFYPFIYPKRWIYEGRAYNEMYLLRAFLMNNDKYSVQFFGQMLMQEYPDKLGNKTKKLGDSLWIRKEF